LRSCYRKKQKQEKRLLLHKAEIKKKARVAFKTAAKSGAAQTLRLNSPKNSRGVNNNNVSKAVDDNGEPLAVYRGKELKKYMEKEIGAKM
jgi:hypothetical protein